jgi:TctA family transporter
MSDTLVKIYLCFVIFVSLLFALLHGVLWLAQRQRPRQRLVTRKLVWRNLFFLLSGLVGWYLFSSRLLNNWLVMLCALSMLVISVAGAEAIGREPKDSR